MQAQIQAQTVRTTRPVLIDSGLGLLGSNGQVSFGLPVPIRQVTKVRLREALIPRTDDILYVLVGFRFNNQSPCDNLRIPHDPTQVAVQNSQFQTGLSQHPPCFAAIPIAQASTIASLSADAITVPYAYVNQERFSAVFQPPITALTTIELQLYQPPSPGDPATLTPYDIRAYKVQMTLPAAGKLPVVGDEVTNIAVSNSNATTYSFTATVLTVAGASSTDTTSTFLLGAFSSYTAADAYIAFLASPGVLPEQRQLFSTDNNAVLGTVTGIAPITTQTVLSLEFECAG